MLAGSFNPHTFKPHPWVMHEADLREVARVGGVVPEDLSHHPCMCQHLGTYICVMHKIRCAPTRFAQQRTEAGPPLVLAAH